MVPKDDRPFSAGELARFRRSPWAARRERWRIWKTSFTTTPAARSTTHMVAGRGRSSRPTFLQRTVPDERLRALLTPDYPFRCKRVLLGADYYLALQQDTSTWWPTPSRG